MSYLGDEYEDLLCRYNKEGADAKRKIDRLRAALAEALPALRMAYKGGHELTENDYLAYKTACELTDPPNTPSTPPAPPKDTP